MAISLNGTTGVDTPGLAVDTDTLYIDRVNNRVGIGTSSPDSRLHVAQNAVNVNVTVENTSTVDGSYASLYIKGTQTNQTFDIGTQILGASAFHYLYGAGDYPLVFYSNFSERMRITSDGNVGIGTSSPQEKFQVDGGGIASISDGSTGGYFLARRGNANNTGGAYYTVWGASNNGQYATAFLSMGGVEANSIGTYAGGAKMEFYAEENHSASATGTGIQFATTPIGTTSLTNRMRIAAGGEVYIAGTTDQGAYNLQCNGTGVWGAGAYVNGSDERIKEDITPISSGLDVVGKLNPVTYRYKESWTKDQSVQTGFIAQELLTALNGEVYVDGIVQQGGAEGYYSVAYQNLIPILTKAIQEQQEIIQSLTARIEALENA